MLWQEYLPTEMFSFEILCRKFASEKFEPPTISSLETRIQDMPSIDIVRITAVKL